jgi:hypothetical protein
VRSAVRFDVLAGDLRMLCGELPLRPPGWSDDEVGHVFRVLQCVGAAKTVTDLTAFQVLRLRAQSGGDPGTLAVSLSASRQLTVAFKTDDTTIRAVIDVLSSPIEESR